MRRVSTYLPMMSLRLSGVRPRCSLNAYKRNANQESAQVKILKKKETNLLLHTKLDSSWANRSIIGSG